MYKTRSTFYLKGKANRAVGEQFNIMAFALGVDIQSNLLRNEWNENLHFDLSRINASTIIITILLLQYIVIILLAIYLANFYFTHPQIHPICLTLLTC